MTIPNLLSALIPPQGMIHILNKIKYDLLLIFYLHFADDSDRLLLKS